MVFNRFLAGSCVLLLGLVGCGGDSTPGVVPDSEMPTSSDPVGTSVPAEDDSTVGYVNIHENPHGRYLHFDAGFLQIDQTDTAVFEPVETGSSWSGERLSDADLARLSDADCLLSSQAAVSDTGDTFENFWPTPAGHSASLGAGPEVAITVDGQSLAVAEQARLGPYTSYATTITFDEPPAFGAMTIDIPGDRFPAFENVSLPPVLPLTLLQPVWPEPIDRLSEFRWTPQDSGPLATALRVRLVASAVRPGTLTTTTVTCLIPDNGSYRFPDAVKSELGDAFRTQHYDLVREHRQVLKNAEATLVVTRSSEE